MEVDQDRCPDPLDALNLPIINHSCDKTGKAVPLSRSTPIIDPSAGAPRMLVFQLQYKDGSHVPIKHKDILKIVKEFLENHNQEGTTQPIMRTDVREAMLRVLRGDEPSDEKLEAIWGRYGDQFRISTSGMLVYRGSLVAAQGDIYKPIECESRPTICQSHVRIGKRYEGREFGDDYIPMKCRSSTIFVTCLGPRRYRT